MGDFKIEQMDQKRFIKANDLKQITNPIIFSSGSDPTPDGLLSNDIFGITKEERSGIYGYIDLTEQFINPYFYKIWLKIDKRLRSIVYETATYKVDSKGNIVEDDNGETGIKFLIKNIDKIKFKDTKKENMLKVLNEKKDMLFTDKFIIIPPFYRDIDTKDGMVSVGEINKLYVNLINNINALKDAHDYGLSMSGGIRGKIQDILMQIYNWYTVGESIIGGEHTGAGIFKKFGIMHRSAMAKTSDYGARLVLSSQKINVDSVDDLMVDFDYSGIPLSAACVCAYPYMIYKLRQYFNNLFGGKATFPVTNKNGEVYSYKLADPLTTFSDDRFDKEINEFVHGFSNRFKPVIVPFENGKSTNLRFKGYSITPEEYAAGKRESENVIDRDVTWLDILFITACEVTEDKMALITRYPVDTYMGQFTTKIRIMSTIETEPLVVNGKLYRWYPKLRQEDIGTDTLDKFIDTLNMANPYCPIMLADFDGDQVSLRIVFSDEANEELKKFNDSNGQFIRLDGINCRVPGNEAIQAMYNLTNVLEGTKLTNPEF